MIAPLFRIAPGLRIPLALLATVLATPGLPAASQPETAEEVVVLPDMTVTGERMLPPPESWLYTTLEDGTEVLSNASEGATKRLLRDFEMFQQALEVVWPLPRTNGPARTLILCGRRDKFDDFTGPGQNAGDIGSTSLFLRNREQAAIIVDLQATSINLSGLFDDTGAVTSNFEVDPYRQLYREYVRYQLSQAGRPPAWLQEGIAQIVMAMEFTPTWIKFGEIDSSRYQATPAASATTEEEEAAEPVLTQSSVGDRPFNVALQRRALIPLEKFFAVTPDAPEARNPLGNNRWAKQAYAFVHLCLYGQNGRYQQSFGRFIQRLGTEPLSESLFKECFKQSYAEMLLNLRGYINYTNHTSKIYKLKAGSRPLGGTPVVLRDATQSEVGRIKGDAQRLAGQPDRALASYRLAYARGEREPALLGAMGVAESEAGKADRARALLESAGKASLRRPGIYVELARQRLAAAKARPAAPEGRLDDVQVARVLDPLFQARRLGPALPQTYEVIGEVWSLSSTPPTAENLAVLGEGLRAFPRDTTLLYHLARIYARTGDPATAIKLAQAGLRFATDDDTRSGFERLLASLPPVPAAR